MRSACGQTGIGKRARDVGLLLCLLIAGLGQYLITTNRNLPLALWLFIPSIVACAFLLRCGGVPARVTGDVPSWQPAAARSVRRRIVAWASVAAGTALLLFTSFLMFSSWHRYYYHSLWLYGGALILLAAGLDHVGKDIFRRVRTVGKSRRWEVFLFAGVLAVGIFMRAYRLDYYPPPTGVSCNEEPQQGDRVYNMLHEGTHPWEFYESNLVTALSFRALGVSMLSLRLPAVVLSVLTLVPFYLLVRLLMGYRVALASTFLFAVSRWHLCYARLSHNVYLPVFFVMLCVYLLVRTGYSRKLSNFVWVGILSGVLLFSYAGYRATIIVVLLYILDKCVRKLWRRRPRGDTGGVTARRGASPLLGLVIVGAVVLAFSLPVFKQVGSAQYYFEAARRSTRPHGGYYAEKDLSEYAGKRWERLVATAGIFTYRGDDSQAMNLPGEPMVDPVTGALFFLGLAYCLVTIGRDEHFFFTVVLFLGIFLGAIFVHNLDVRRLISTIPLLYVYAAFSLSALWAYIDGRCGRRGRGAFIAVVVAVCLFSFCYNYARFFGAQISDKRVRLAYKNHYTILIEHIKDLPPDRYVVVVSPIIHNLFMPNDYKWLYEARGKCARTFEEIFPLPESGDVTVIFQHPHDIVALSARLEKRFPGTACEYFTDPERADLRIAVCTLPSGGTG